MLRFLAFALIAFGLSAPAEAQSRRELAARLDAVEARLSEAEAQALQGDPVAETLMARLDALEREQRVLTGEIERLAFENRTMRRELEQLGRNVDVLFNGGATAGVAGDGPALLEPDEIDPNDPFAEARAADVQPLQLPQDGPSQGSQGAATQTPGAGVPAALDAPADAAADPDAVFSNGRARLLDGDFAGAREAFERYTEQFPEGDQAGEAWYWLGETHFVSGAYEEAADAYIASLRADRRGVRGPDALVRLGASLAGLGQTGRACDVLATFPQEFPNASEDARRKAQREVSRIGCR
jgi:tol-pal system protein YbgF